MVRTAAKPSAAVLPRIAFSSLSLSVFLCADVHPPLSMERLSNRHTERAARATSFCPVRKIRGASPLETGRKIRYNIVYCPLLCPGRTALLHAKTKV